MEGGRVESEPASIPEEGMEGCREEVCKGAEEPEEAWNYLLFLTTQIISKDRVRAERAGTLTYLLPEA